MHLFRAKTFLCRPGSRTQTFRYRSIKQNKRFCYRLSKQNKTTLGTMSSNFLESTDPSTDNVCFFRFGTMSFKLSQPAIPYNDSCLASKKITLLRVIPTMTFIHFLTGKSSGILSDISSDILFDILSGISSGV